MDVSTGGNSCSFPTAFLISWIKFNVGGSKQLKKVFGIQEGKQQINDIHVQYKHDINTTLTPL
jgi:hypothetical protein